MNQNLKKFILTCPLALGTLLVPSYLSEQQNTVVAILAFLSFLMLTIEWNKRNLFLYLLVFVSGPLAEALAIYLGLWSYSQPAILGFPLWLPFVWGNSSLYIIRLKALIDSFVK